MTQVIKFVLSRNKYANASNPKRKTKENAKSEAETKTNGRLIVSFWFVFACERVCVDPSNTQSKLTHGRSNLLFFHRIFIVQVCVSLFVCIKVTHTYLYTPNNV